MDNSSMIEPLDFEVWCDKPSDRELAYALKQISPFFKNIEKIFVIPNNAFQEAINNPDLQHVHPLIIYDRPDLIIFYKKRPILVVELTEHGYTGDNPLQRFARAVRSAELRVPFIHFTPFSRTRLDEILYSDAITSSRRVSSRLFDGFMKLTRIYQVPIVAVNWVVNDRGIASKASLTNPEELQDVYGNLLNVIEEICFKHVDDVLSQNDFRDAPVIKEIIGINQQLADDSNTLDSEIRLENIDYGEVLRIIGDPSYVVSLIGRDYFYKGKDHKLIAFLALMSGKIEAMQIETGRMIPLPNEITQIKSNLPSEFSAKNWFLLYSGYEWRGEPNGGIAANAEIVNCRSEGGINLSDRDNFLVVVWPRVFFNRMSPIRARLLNELKKTDDEDESSKLYQLIAEKRDSQGKEMNGTYIRYATKSYGVWSENSTIARIYRTFCDLILLNDAILLGNQWVNSHNPRQITEREEAYLIRKANISQSDFFNQLKERGSSEEI